MAQMIEKPRTKPLRASQYEFIEDITGYVEKCMIVSQNELERLERIGFKKANYDLVMASFQAYQDVYKQILKLMPRSQIVNLDEGF